jgi:TRAP-type mannitol/chloroaromatic compound transport system substrate-binding protein
MTTQDEKTVAARKSRRGFLRAGATAAVAGAALSMPSISRAQTVTLKIQGSWGAKDVFNEMAQDYVDRINAMGGSRLKLDYLLAGAVVHPFSVQDATHKGVLDGAHTVPVYWYGKHKAASLFGSGPVFGANANQQMGWFAQGGGKALFKELVQDILKLNIVSFFAMPMPTQPLGWFKKEIKSVDDIKGLKYRTVGLAANLMQAMGLSVTQLPGARSCRPCSAA